MSKTTKRLMIGQTNMMESFDIFYGSAIVKKHVSNFWIAQDDAF